MSLNSLCLPTSLTLSQYLRGILFGISSIGGEPGGRRPSKHVLWGINKTTPGMIATAATIVCLLLFF
jgi:hypothetical protein